MATGNKQLRGPEDPTMAELLQTIQGGGGPPAIDPTKLTTDAVNAATVQLRRDIESSKQIIETRLDGMDDAIALHAQVAPQVAERAERQTLHLQELLDAKINSAILLSESERNILLEKFNSIDRQFVERDVRTDQAARSSADALAAALQAAKELVGSQGEASAAAAVKSETSFTKQIDQIGTIIQTLEKALDARITELKERIDRGEGSDRGRVQNQNEYRDVRAESRGDRQNVIAYVAAGIAAIAVVVVLFVGLNKDSISNSTLPSCTSVAAGVECVTVK